MEEGLAAGGQGLVGQDVFIEEAVAVAVTKRPQPIPKVRAWFRSIMYTPKLSMEEDLELVPPRSLTEMAKVLPSWAPASRAILMPSPVQVVTPVMTRMFTSPKCSFSISSLPRKPPVAMSTALA